MPKIGLTFEEIDSLIGRDLRAWTGGSTPRPITQVSREERRAISIRSKWTKVPVKFRRK